MSGLPYANARLTIVQPGGTSQDYDTDATAGTAKWTGELDVAVIDEYVDRPVGGVLNRVKVTSMTIPLTPTFRKIALANNDTLTYVQDGVTLTRLAKDVRYHQALGIAEAEVWDT